MAAPINNLLSAVLSPSGSAVSSWQRGRDLERASGAVAVAVPEPRGSQGWAVPVALWRGWVKGGEDPPPHIMVGTRTIPAGTQGLQWSCPELLFQQLHHGKMSGFI